MNGSRFTEGNMWAGHFPTPVVTDLQGLTQVTGLGTSGIKGVLMEKERLI